MNIVDGLCKLCNKPIRILIGTPAICAECSRKRASKMFCIALVVLLMLTLLDTLLSGCAVPVAVATTRHNASAPTIQLTPILVSHTSAKVLAVCVDVTGSYPEQYVYAALRKLA